MDQPHDHFQDDSPGDETVQVGHPTTRLRFIDQEAEAPEPFAGLFADYDDSRHLVMLRRITPENMMDRATGERVRIAGFLENLPKGLESYESYIQSKYGGGQYQATRKLDGRFERQISIDISGPPRMPEAEPPALIRSRQVPNALHTDETYEGVAIGGTDDDFAKRLERMLLITASLNAVTRAQQPQDINAVLLQHILAERTDQADPLAQITRLTEIQKNLMDALPNTGGTDVMALVNNALTTLTTMVQKTPARPAPRRPAPALTAPPQSTAPQLPNANTVPPQEETPTMPPTPRELAGLAIAQIVQIFQADPETPIADVVTLLDNTLQMATDQRANLKPFRGGLYAGAIGQMAETIQFAETVEAQAAIRAQFKAFFDAVFDAFTDPQRESLVIR